MAQDPYRYFRPEARDLLDQFAQGILELEKSGSSAGAVQRLLRLAHTLKGAARVVRQSAIAERAHAIEDALAPFRDCADEHRAREHRRDPGAPRRNRQPDRHLGAGRRHGGRRSRHSRNAQRSPATDAAADAAKSVAADARRVIRADIAEMDAVLDGVSETQARLNGLRRSAEAIEQAGHLADLLRAQLRRRARPSAAERQPRAVQVSACASRKSCAGRSAVVARDLDTAIAQMDRELRQLRDAAEGLRLVAVDSLFTALERTARDAARALSKQVTFEGNGGDIRLDADVLGSCRAR